MTRSTHIAPYIANDNSPETEIFRGDVVGFNAALRERQRDRARHEQELSEAQQIAGKSGFWISAILWSGFSLGLGWAIMSSQSVTILIFCAIGMIWTGLWTRFLALDLKKPRFAELCVCSVWIACVGIVYSAESKLGYEVSLAIPALWAGMLLLSARLKSRIGILASVAIGYIWLIGSTVLAFTDSNISAIYLSVGAVVLGTLHYRAAKAAEDEGLSFTSIHVLAGWAVANAGLLAIANYAYDPAEAFWQSGAALAPIPSFVWAIVMIFALATVFATGLIRRQHERMSLAGVCATTLLLACIPIGLWYQNSLAVLFDRVIGVSIYPALGLFLFGVAACNILFFMANGFRRKNFSHVASALAMLAALTIAAKPVGFVAEDNWAVWMFGTIAAFIVTFIAVEPQLGPLEAPELPTGLQGS